MLEEYKINTKNILNTRMIMIESDAGYIDPKDVRNNNFILEMTKIGDSNKFVIAEPLIVYVVLQKFDVINHNGRIYPESILKREANKYLTLINENRAIGEHNHPESSIISGDRVSHNITEIWWEGNTLMGKMEILMSPGFINSGIISCQGDMVANLLRKRIRIGVSSRGVGSLREVNGKNIVQEDFEIICWDVVTTPSTPGSWIFDKREEAKPFMESISSKKPLLNQKLDNFLND
jgi:hypothetical protein